MFETKAKEIDGINFKCVPFSVREALQLKVYLLKVLAPALGGLMGGLDPKAGVMNQKLDSDIFIKALESVSANISETEFMLFFERCLKNVVAEITDAKGSKTLVEFGNNFNTTLDIVFQGKIFTIYKVVYFVLEVNFPDFFGGVVKAFGDKLKTVTTEKVRTSENS